MLHRADATPEPLDFDDPAACARWDAFVRADPSGTPFHLTAWARAIERALGHKPIYLQALANREVVGVLPLIHVRSPIFGPSLISNAFAVYGGPLAGEPAVHEALDRAAWEVAQRLKIPVLEYRDQERLRPHWPAKSETYATFKRALGDSEETNLKAIPRKQRAEVRRSLDFDLDTRVARDSRAVDEHFAVYAASVRNLGTPVFPKRLFAALLEAFGEDADILTVSRQGRPIASVLSLYHGQEVLPYYGGGTPDARTWRANDHMYWQLMEHARRRGCTSFDFGRSKTGTGPYSFKKNWGFEPRPLHYEFRLAHGAEMPDLNPMNPKYRLMVQTWQRLPLWLANRLGPLVARGLG